MCGIFFSLCRHGHVTPDVDTRNLLNNRGPDNTGTLKLNIAADEHASQPLYATFLSTVLSLRGTSIVQQPLNDASTGSVLCWNGEAWSIGSRIVQGNDSRQIFESLLHASIGTSASREHSITGVVGLLSSIRGPFAFVFYDAPNHYIYYGRDCLGRRSLLRKSAATDQLILSSVCDNSSGDQWAEVEADGLYVVDLKARSPFDARRIPHCHKDQLGTDNIALALPFPAINRSAKPSIQADLSRAREALEAALRESLSLRTQHVRESFQSTDTTLNAEVAILFSGGLDCTLLARLVHDLLATNKTIDLLNVAFENPRIHRNLDPGVSPYELCPDRITGRASHAELQMVCPNRRWRFVEINVPYTETISQRTRVMALMHPHNTEMDLSISYALYFASRGEGVVCGQPKSPSSPYTTHAHVLLSGLGADELFGGYQRHASAFARAGYEGLIDELELDFDRLGKRNLGRDDRIISDSGKEVRFPYLDEDFIALALSLPVSVKCDFGLPQTSNPDDGDQLLEPAKRILRVLARDLGMKGAAMEKKRAIQFGARTAKMETGKVKGTHTLS
ncbi:asparagine synthetase domain-containing protein 1 [Amniculicola lignicola CBS 123094]|uniref:Asparagine synthetase domain-containing protein 1 n=1 Tax=Amniculicola lignicola CBS 123094 TaxID=1392246 RepID=A0A6A5VSS3_9PLEO|nr:asparagine synthetase domain-containing protein 1 [Amniculicola lignicola CBS 123094]